MKIYYLLLASFIFFLTGCGPSEKELMSSAREMMTTGDFVAALPLLDKVIQADANNKVAYNMRGITKLELGQTDRAILDFDVSINLDSNDYRSFYNRGNAKYQIGRYNQAIADYDVALELEPREADIYINRGNTLVQMNRYPEAVRDYEFALKLDENNYLTHFNLARTYYLMNNLEFARRSFENCVHIYDTYAPGYYFLGMIALEDEELEDSCELFKKAADLGYEQAKEVLKLYCQEN